MESESYLLLPKKKKKSCFSLPVYSCVALCSIFFLLVPQFPSLYIWYNNGIFVEVKRVTLE